MAHVQPASGVLTQRFGCTGVTAEPPYGACAHFHFGWDIANVSGTPVRASDGGTVLAADWNGYACIDGVCSNWGYGGGNNIIIRHTALPFFTIYAHLRSFAVRVGQSVVKGQVIGYMDSTGNASGPHVHWGAWAKSLWWTHGVPIDPRRILAGGDLANNPNYQHAAVTYVYLNADGVRVRNQPSVNSTVASPGAKDQRFVYGGTVVGGYYTVNGVTDNHWVKVWFNSTWYYVAKNLVHF